MNLQGFVSLDNPFVLQTLCALATIALGVLGMLLGQRIASNGRLCIVLGAAVGVAAMSLLCTPLATLAPGWALVFLSTFAVSDKLAKLTSRNDKS